MTANVKMTFEECCTILTQIEECLNSRPLIAKPCDEDGIEMITPGHLVGRLKHFRIRLTHIVLYLCYDDGKVLSDISGNDGRWSIYCTVL